ncbi:hypothetical protein EV13_2442 [Prochlorococcus sp. MIT 0702]|nr:hypothetical protein EV13_2442 [Prochlorococcus sp. MIT 0702]KGG31275.1 hypothetical protein EV14_2647 [Prochlorococcus sp. MIT 0703]
MIEQFSVVVVSVESSHGFKGDKCVSCVGLFSLDSYKISAFLVISTTQLWCRPQEVLVSFW